MLEYQYSIVVVNETNKVWLGKNGGNMQIDFLDMVKNIANGWNVHLSVTGDGEGDGSLSDFDMGIRRALLNQFEKDQLLSILDKESQEFGVYFISDYFDVEYCCMEIPESEKQYGKGIILGPYRDSTITELELQKLMQEKGISQDFFSELEEYYNAIPTIVNITQWRNICLSIACLLHRNPNLRMHFLTQTALGSDFRSENNEDELSVKVIEERYAAEGQILKAISQGNLEDAMKYMTLSRQYKLKPRFKDSVREARNMMIVTNTLWRKAAEAGGVHPVYIDRVSRNFALKIEKVSSEQEFQKLMSEMLRRYCMLVKNYSLKDCSPVVQKVANHINLNLTEDLSLNRLAAEYKINPSYLSTLFKKEIGETITCYVNQQRIRKAIALLNSTNLSVQDVAGECGIFDVNYFRKQFKKMTGQTPTAYMKLIRSYK